VVIAAGSLVGRFPRARGVERLQLQWVALAAVVVVMAGVLVLAGLAVEVASASTLLSMVVGLCLATLPVATGAAVLRYRLYDCGGGGVPAGPSPHPAAKPSPVGNRWTGTGRAQLSRRRRHRCRSGG
jgi:hypothetical protein